MNLLLDTVAYLYWLLDDWRLSSTARDAMSEATNTLGLRVAASLAPHHRDPFDRLIIAQTQLESMAVVTNDSAFTAYGIQTIW